MSSLERTWLINNKETTVSVEGACRLLDVLREDLDLIGTKEGCGEGECGACTVLLNDRPVASCLVPAAQVQDGDRILTVEGLADTELGRVLQVAYQQTGAVQCGFCTPGMLISSYALLADGSQPDEAKIREALAGNLCRCTGYEKIIEAVQLAAKNWAAQNSAA